MTQEWRTFGRGLLWAGAAVAFFGLSWAAIAEAKDCTMQAGNCVGGDTLVQSGTMSSDLYAYGVDQGLHLADYVTLDCDHHWTVGNYTYQSAGFRLGHGSGLYNCYIYGFEIGVKFNGWQAWMIGGYTYGLGQEGLHFTNGQQGNYVCCMTVQAPQEGLYFQGAHTNVVEYVTVYGSPATYANDGASYNQVKYCDLNGGSNRSIFSAAGSMNEWTSDDYHGGVVRSLGGSQYPNWIGPSPNAQIQNFDGSLYIY